MLIVFSGLPSAGKSTIARALANRLGAFYIRIDTIEQALRRCGTLPAGVVNEGYAVGYSVAEDNLRVGSNVIADSVNPLDMTRDAWAAVAERPGVRLFEVEIICSDGKEHRRRVESRSADISGLTLPTWDAVQRRLYHPWTRPCYVLDTASRPVDVCLDQLISALRVDQGPTVATGAQTSIGTHTRPQAPP